MLHPTDIEPARLGPADLRLRRAFKVATAATMLTEVATELERECPQCAGKLSALALMAADVSESLEAQT